MRSVPISWSAVALLSVILAGCEATDPVEPWPEPTPVASVLVTPKDGVWTGSLKVGQAIELKAAPKAADGSDIPALPVVWTSSDTAIAVVSGTGRVVARAAGTVTVHAAVSGQAGQIDITVVHDQPPPATVARVDVSPAAAILQIGQTRRYIARAFDSNGNELHDRAITWSTSVPAIVSVSTDGVVRGLAHGYGDVIAIIDGRSSAVGVTVVPADPERLRAVLRTVAGNPLPAVLRTFTVTDERGIELTRTIKVTAGSITVDLQNQRYEQQVTMELWEDSYSIINGEPFFCCIQLKDRKVHDDRGSVAPLYSGSGTLVFQSEMIAGHTFTGFGTGTGVEITQRVINSGNPVVLRFAW